MKQFYVIYGKPGCPYCDLTKALLTNKGTAFDYIDISEDEDAKYYITQVLKVRTVPQVFVKQTGQHVGGFQELKTLLDEQELEDLWED